MQAGTPGGRWREVSKTTRTRPESGCNSSGADAEPDADAAAGAVGGLGCCSDRVPSFEVVSSAAGARGDPMALAPCPSAVLPLASAVPPTPTTGSDDEEAEAHDAETAQLSRAAAAAAESRCAAAVGSAVCVGSVLGESAMRGSHSESPISK